MALFALHDAQARLAATMFRDDNQCRLPDDCLTAEALPPEPGVERLELYRVDVQLPGEADEVGERITFASLDGVALRMEAGEGALNDGNGTVLCLYQHKEWWMRPQWCDEWRHIPSRTQMMLWKDAGGMWRLALAACVDDCRADLRGSERGGNGYVTLGLSFNTMARTHMQAPCMVAARGRNPYALVHAAAGVLARQCGVRTRDERPFPQGLEGLGWCTWDAFGTDVSEELIMRKMEEFKAKNVPISWVLIDDGWSQVNAERRTLWSFDARANAFPHGLSHTVRLLKERYGVRSVGVWQAFSGYWAGVDPLGPVAREVRDCLERTPSGMLVPDHDCVHAATFWNAWDHQLDDDGIDFVKVDAQSSIPLMMRGKQGFTQATEGRHVALDAVAAHRFGGAVINCMGLAPENLWHRPLSPLLRSSDDFSPGEPESLGEHVVENAYVSLLAGELYHCDWDMFWSEHPDARTHALLRWFSGGPVYCSDPIGVSDSALLQSLLDKDGKLLRPDDVARPLEESLLADPVHGGRALGLRNTVKGFELRLFVGLNMERNQRGRIDAAADNLAVIDIADGSMRIVPRGLGIVFELPYAKTRLFAVRAVTDSRVLPEGIPELARTVNM